MTSYGRLGAFLEDHNALPGVVPGHVDGAAGSQTDRRLLLLAGGACRDSRRVPCGLVVSHPHRLAGTLRLRREPYLAMLVGAVLVEMLAFLAPMARFHRHMVVTKRTLLTEADRLSRQITQLEAALAGGDVDGEAAVRSRAQSARDQYMAIEALPRGRSTLEPGEDFA
jgi:hypothetical protein